MASKARGNTTVTYNSNALQSYTTQVTYSANGETIDVTDLASTGREFIQDVVEHSINISGWWDPTLDGYLQPEVGSGTKRTLALGMSDGTTTVTYTWTTNAEVSSYEVDMSVGAAGTFSATFSLSGAPGRVSA